MDQKSCPLVSTTTPLKRYTTAVIEVSGVDGQTSAYDLTAHQYAVESEPFIDRDGRAIGRYVTSINGIAADDTHFWELLINGASSQLAASSLIPKPGDKITWVLQKFDSRSV